MNLSCFSRFDSGSSENCSDIPAERSCKPPVLRVCLGLLHLVPRRGIRKPYKVEGMTYWQGSSRLKRADARLTAPLCRRLLPRSNVGFGSKRVLLLLLLYVVATASTAALVCRLVVEEIQQHSIHSPYDDEKDLPPTTLARDEDWGALPPAMKMSTAVKKRWSLKKRGARTGLVVHRRVPGGTKRDGRYFFFPTKS